MDGVRRSVVEEDRVGFNGCVEYALQGGGGDKDRTLRVCNALVGDSDPMVAKGLSWALRALISVDGTAVGRFLDKNHETLPALVRREVGNKLRTGRKNPGR